MATGTILRAAPDNADTLLKVVAYTYNWTGSIASDKNLTITADQFGMAVPSGYSAVGIGRFSSGTNACVVTQTNPYATGTGAAMVIRNMTEVSVSDKTAKLEVLYARTGFCA